MAKRSFSSTGLPEGEDIGYISKVSELLTSKKMNKYFEGQLQTKTASYRYINFNIDKHQEFQKAEKLNSPVKFHNYKLSPDNRGQMEILLNKYTKLEYFKNAAFKRRIDFDASSTTSSASGSTQSESTKIENIDFSKSHQPYNIIAKVIQHSSEDKEMISIFGSMKYKTESLVADETGVVMVTLYESLIDQVETGKTYTFLNLSTRNFDKPKLTSTRFTEIKVADDIDIVSDATVSYDCKTLTGTIEQIQCSNKMKCPVCDKPVLDDPNALKLRCTSCHLKTHKRSVKEVLTCRINLKEETGTMHGLVAFHNTIAAFLRQQKKEQLMKNPDQLEDFFLDLPKVVIKYRNNGNGDIVSAFEL